MFTEISVLMQFNLNHKIIMKTDFFRYVINKLLQQYDDQDFLHLCVFFFCKNKDAECNYKIYNKKLLIIVKCLREWNSELHNVEKFKILTDHKNLEYFIITCKLTEQQIKWVKKLSKFNFHIIYKSEREETQSDVLSHWEQNMLKNEDSCYTHHKMMLLKLKLFKQETLITFINFFNFLKIVFNILLFFIISILQQKLNHLLS